MARKEAKKPQAPVKFQVVNKTPEAPPVQANPRVANSPQLDALKEEITTLREAFERSETMVASHLATLMENLDGVHTLSELLSVRYNPFLEGTEEQLFDGKTRQTLADMVRSLPRPDEDEKPADRPQRQPPEPLPKVPKLPRWEDLPPPGPEDLGDPVPVHDLAAPWPDHKPRRDVVKVEVPELDPSNAFVGAPRPTFLALSWIDEMQDKIPPEAIFLCLDYYRDIGWIDEPAYDWMCVLASGSVDRDPHASWSNLGLSARRLTAIHQTNLVFLNNLFNERLGPEERRSLRNQVRSDFEGL